MASEGEGNGESEGEGEGEGEGLARMETPVKINKTISKLILDIVKTQAYID
jgi:hypothetical protein